MSRFPPPLYAFPPMYPPVPLPMPLPMPLPPPPRIASPLPFTLPELLRSGLTHDPTRRWAQLGLGMAGDLLFGKLASDAGDAAEAPRRQIAITNTLQLELTVLGICCQPPAPELHWDPHAVPATLRPGQSLVLDFTTKVTSVTSVGTHTALVMFLLANPLGQVVVPTTAWRVEVENRRAAGEVGDLRLDPKAKSFVPQQQQEALRRAFAASEILVIEEAARSLPPVPLGAKLYRNQPLEPHAPLITAVIQAAGMPLSSSEAVRLRQLLGSLDPALEKAVWQDLVRLGALTPANYAARFALLLNAEERVNVADVNSFALPAPELSSFRSVTTADGKALHTVKLAVPGSKENRPAISIFDVVQLRWLANPAAVVALNAEVVSKVGDDLFTLQLPDPPAGLSYAENSAVWVACFHHVSRHFDLMLFALSNHMRVQHLLWPQEQAALGLKPVAASLWDERQWKDPSLNEEQRQAVANIVERVRRKPLAAPPYIVFGPPGTGSGKTKTMIEAIWQSLKINAATRILAVAPSNTAADVICERLAEAGLTANDSKRINWFQRPLNSVPGKLLRYCTSSAGGIFRMPKLEELRSTRVVVATCVAIGALVADALNGGTFASSDYFDVVIVDECAQATEPELLLPLLLASPTTTVVLCGDPKQLGPSILSPVAVGHGLDISLQERLMSLACYGRREPQLITLLKKNYRSHAAIVDMWSKLFYQHEVHAVGLEERLISCVAWRRLPQDKEFPWLFWGVEGQCYISEDGASLSNIAEATEIAGLISDLLQSPEIKVDVSEIGVVAPYRLQVLAIRKILRSRKLGAVDVGSVDDFQGKEKKAMFISTVVSRDTALRNVEHRDREVIDHITFLSNPKRFNVAISRGEALVVIVGNPFALREDPCWRAVLQHCIQEGAYKGITPPRFDEQASSPDSLALLAQSRLHQHFEVAAWQPTAEELEQMRRSQLPFRADF